MNFTNQAAGRCQYEIIFPEGVADCQKCATEMSLPFQIIFGSVDLGLCSLVHLRLLGGAVQLLQTLGKRFDKSHRGRHWGMLTAVGVTAVVFAHTFQVWIWAARHAY